MATDPLDEMLDRSAPARTNPEPRDAGAMILAASAETQSPLVHAAELLGIPSSTASGRYARARELLRAELAVGAAPNAENGAGFA